MAQLAISEAEESLYANRLNKVLTLAKRLADVDTTGIAPMAHPLDMPQRLREDVVTESNQRELLQQNAPQTAAGLYLVPKVID